MERLRRRIRRILVWVWEAVVGDPRDYAPSNANFLGALLPIGMSLLGGLFKKKAQGKASKQQADYAAQMKQYERDMQRRGMESWNTQRTSDVNRKRSLLKAAITSKGWGNSPIWESLGGMDAFFNRPVSGLKDTSMFDYAAPEQQQGGGGGWNMFGDLLGTGAQAVAAYQKEKAGEEAGNQNALAQFFGRAGGDPSKAMEQQNNWNDFLAANK